MVSPCDAGKRGDGGEEQPADLRQELDGLLDNGNILHVHTSRMKGSVFEQYPAGTMRSKSEVRSPWSGVRGPKAWVATLIVIPSDVDVSLAAAERVLRCPVLRKVGTPRGQTGCLPLRMSLRLSELELVFLPKVGTLRAPAQGRGATFPASAAVSVSALCSGTADCRLPHGRPKHGPIAPDFHYTDGNPTQHRVHLLHWQTGIDDSKPRSGVTFFGFATFSKVVAVLQRCRLFLPRIDFQDRTTGMRHRSACGHTRRTIARLSRNSQGPLRAKRMSPVLCAGPADFRHSAGKCSSRKAMRNGRAHRAVLSRFLSNPMTAWQQAPFLMPMARLPTQPLRKFPSCSD